MCESWRYVTAKLVSKIDEVAKEFRFTLKEKQKEVISALVSGNDFFLLSSNRIWEVTMLFHSTKGYDCIHNVKGLLIVLCVSPLVVLMMDQENY